jgi:hypothetical protein
VSLGLHNTSFFFYRGPRSLMVISSPFQGETSRSRTYVSTFLSSTLKKSKLCISVPCISLDISAAYCGFPVPMPLSSLPSCHWFSRFSGWHSCFGFRIIYFRPESGVRACVRESACVGRESGFRLCQYFLTFNLLNKEMLWMLYSQCDLQR